MRFCNLFILLVLVTFLPFSSFAEDPAWITLEKGKASLEQRNLSAALDYFLDAVEQESDYPEAEYWLGRVYEAQGQNVLAEEQYRRALELSPYLMVPDDEIEYQYRLAGLIRNEGPARTAEVEAILMGIVDRSGGSSENQIKLEHRYIALITEEGLDELLFLYRDILGASLKARRELAEIAWEAGRYKSALLHSTYVVLSMLSTAGDYIRSRDDSWRFDIDPVLDPRSPDRDVRYPGASDGAGELLDRSSGYRKLAEWLDAEGLWPSLYLLGSALYAEGFPDAANSTWQLLVENASRDNSIVGRPEAGRWGRYAVAQLEEPFISSGNLSP